MNQFIVIEGNIGTGKTSLASMLALRYGAELMLENFEDNTFLKGFYQNPKKYAFPLELSFLADRYQHLKDFELKTKVVADYHLSKSLSFASHTLDADEFELFKRLFDIMVPKVRQVDLLVYLKRSPEILLKNIKKRGREYEQNIDMAYLAKVESSYLDYLSRSEAKRVQVIDCGDIDFVNNAADYLKVLNVIENNEDKPYAEFKLSAY